MKKWKLRRISFKPMFLFSLLTNKDSYNTQIIQCVNDTIFRNRFRVPGFGTGSYVKSLEPFGGVSGVKRAVYQHEFYCPVTVITWSTGARRERGLSASRDGAVSLCGVDEKQRLTVYMTTVSLLTSLLRPIGRPVLRLAAAAWQCR